MTLTHNNT